MAINLRTISGVSFLGDILKLSIGTLLGRLIAFLVLPLLTRLYSPENFALLATYLAIIGTMSVVACFRFEIAIPLADSDEEGVNLLALALAVLGLVTGIATLLVVLLSDRLTDWIGSPAIEPYLWLFPLGIALAGIYSAFQYWATRMKRFGPIARTRVVQSIMGTTTMLSMGWLVSGPFGLLLGNALNFGAGGFGLAIEAWRKDTKLLRQITFPKMLVVMRRYGRYPLLSAPEALLNVGGRQWPILIIAAVAETEAGFLMLATQLLSVPMALLGGSISQVYMSRAPEAMREGRLRELTFSIMRRLAAIGIPTLLAVGVLAPFFVPYLFGSEWAGTGIIITWMVPWLALQFIASPVSMVMYVTGRQRGMLALTTLGLFLRVGCTVIAYKFGVISPILGFVVGSIVYYISVMVCVIYAAQTSRH